MSTPHAEQARAHAFDLIQQGQDATMKLISSVSESWAGLAGGGAGTTGALPGGPAEMIDRVYDTGIQILEAQRAMAHGILEATAPAMRAFTAPGR